MLVDIALHFADGSYKLRTHVPRKSGLARAILSCDSKLHPGSLIVLRRRISPVEPHSPRVRANPQMLAPGQRGDDRVRPIQMQPTRIARPWQQPRFGQETQFKYRPNIRCGETLALRIQKA